MSERDQLVAQMQRDGTWQPMFGAMLAEVAEALRMGTKLREAAELLSRAPGLAVPTSIRELRPPISR